jgi:hypothetical protein
MAVDVDVPSVCTLFSTCKRELCFSLYSNDMRGFVTFLEAVFAQFSFFHLRDNYIYEFGSLVQTVRLSAPGSLYLFVLAFHSVLSLLKLFAGVFTFVLDAAALLVFTLCFCATLSDSKVTHFRCNIYIVGGSGPS